MSYLGQLKNMGSLFYDEGAKKDTIVKLWCISFLLIDCDM